MTYDTQLCRILSASKLETSPNPPSANLSALQPKVVNGMRKYLPGIPCSVKRCDSSDFSGNISCAKVNAELLIWLIRLPD